MFRNYLYIGLRNILKYKVFSFINVFGLAVSLSVCLLIILMLADQKSYDRFHKKKDRIYRVLTDPVDRQPYATTPAPLAEALSNGFTNVSSVTQLVKGFGGDAFYQQNYAELKGYFADPSFFKIFDFGLAKGDPESALSLPNSMVITAEVARKLFKDEDPIGKVVNFSDRGIDFYTEEGNAPVDWGEYKITGVLDDVHYKTHLRFDVLASVNSLPLLYQQNKVYDASQIWNDYSRAYTYVLLPTQSHSEAMDIALDHLATEKFKDYEYLKGSTFLLQSITKISPGPMLGNDSMVGLPKVIYFIFLGLLLIIVGSACINYTNLSIARAVTRFKEIGVRKVNGAKRKDLVIQFLCESLIMSLLVLGLAFILLLFIKSAFLNLWLNQSLNFELNLSLRVILIFSTLTLTVVVGAGLVPALHLSGYKPVKAFGNNQASAGNGYTFRKILTVTQFVVSLLFIVTTLVVFKQFNHYMSFEYGFNPNQVMNISLQSNQYSLVRNTFKNTAGVYGVAGCGYLPGTGRNNNTTIKNEGSDKSIQAIDLGVDENFLEVMEIGLVAGQNLSPSDGNPPSSILVNERAVMDLGYKAPADIVGEVVTEGDSKLTVVGVFEDITFFLLFSKKPTGAIVLRNDPQRFNFASVKIASNDYREVIGNLEDEWKKVDPIHPLKYEFYQEKLTGYNRVVFDLVTVMGFFAFVAITIACLGLLGITIYTTERRTKEIGIRKVLGARRFGMALLLSKDYLKLLAISILIAGPLSFYINRLWLDTLVVRAPFNFGTVLLGAILLLGMGILFIGPQTLKIAGTNPVDTLKTE